MGDASTAVLPPLGGQSAANLPQMHITFTLVAVVLASLALFIVLCFICFRTIHVNWDQIAYHQDIARTVAQVINGSAAAGVEEAAMKNSGGLEASYVSRLPILQYSSDLLREEAAGMKGANVQNVVVMKECPVCLSEYEEGEEMKVLPVCGHCFHKACIDVWLSSHNTCPICRRSLLKQIHGVHGGDRANAVHI